MKHFLFLFFFCTACEVGPRYVPPIVDTPNQWKTQQAESELPPFVNWWEVFQDPQLNFLEEQALDNNPNIELALDHIEEAWALAGINRADLFPQVNFTPAASHTNLFLKIFHPEKLQNILPQPPNPNPNAPSIKLPNHIRQFTYSLPLNLNYEIDLWGKYRKAYSSAVNNAQSLEESYRAAILSLTTDVASSYFNLRTLDAAAQYLRSVILTRQADLNINQSRFSKGLINYTDVSNAIEAWSTAESDLQDTLRQRRLQENMIAALVGLPASSFVMDPNPLSLSDQPPVIPAGIPSSILLQRPDLASAERTMASQHDQINVAYASFFPSFSLTGTLNYLSIDFKDFIEVLTKYFTFGVNANQTIFDGGKLRSNLEVAVAKFKEASDTYKLNVLTAFREVEDALNNLERQRLQTQSLETSVSAAQTTTRLAKRRYLSGLANYFEVVNNERTELNAEITYINVLGQRYQSTIQLIKALGGSWNKSCVPITEGVALGKGVLFDFAAEEQSSA